MAVLYLFVEEPNPRHIPASVKPLDNSCNVTLLYYNICSLLPKFDGLKIICTMSSSDIVCVVETWLYYDITDSEISIQGYHLVRLDHSRHGGGVLIYANSMFTCSLLFKGTPDFECLTVYINCCNVPGRLQP